MRKKLTALTNKKTIFFFKPLLVFVGLFLVFTMPVKLFAQAPTISYSGPQVYTTGQAITPLIPTSSGVVPVAQNATVLSNSFYPYAVAADAAGDVYMSDNNNNVVWMLPAGGGAPVTVGSGFLRPTGIAVDQDGNVYVADSGNGVIKKILASDGSIVSLAGPSANYTLGAICLDAGGNIYALCLGVYSSIAPVVCKFSHTGMFLASLGAITDFHDPRAIAADEAGNVYVADGFNHTIKEVVAATGNVIVLNHTSGAYPYGIARDRAGNLFIADFILNTIGKIPAGSGVETTIATGVNGAFNLAADGANNLYVASNANYTTNTATIEKITPAGGYFITPGLPPGLVFNNSTGAITGTPLAPSPATDYTITAVNGSGSSTATVNIKVITHNANLTRLTASAGVLSPVFAAGTTNYTVSTGTETKLASINATAFDPEATIKVNGVVTPQGLGSANVPLVRGANAIPVVVTSRDGVTTKTYHLTVTRAPLIDSNNAHLASIVVSSGTLSPALSSDVFKYTDTVSNATTSILLTATTLIPNAKITLGFFNQAPGTASINTVLNVGSNIFTITTYSEDGSAIIQYTVNVVRPSNNASLAAISLTNNGAAVALSPAFSTSTYNYYATVPGDVTSVTESLYAANIVSVTVNGVPFNTSANIPLSPGLNKITNVVTAQDGITQKTYTVNVTRQKPSIATLSGLTVDGGPLNQTLTDGTFNYSFPVSDAATSVTINATATDPLAKVYINGTLAASGVPKVVPITGGNILIYIDVLAQDGVTDDTYLLSASRLSNNAYLAHFLISRGTLSPAFALSTANYTATVGNAYTSVRVTPFVAIPGATVKVNGVAVTSGELSQELPLNVGPNTISVLVTAQNGVTHKTYTVIVTRGGNNATLSDLAISTGVLSPAFATGTTAYTDTVSNATTSVTVTPAVGFAGSMVSVNGTLVSPGTASNPIPLATGNTTISVVVTSPDGISQTTYTVVVNRISNNAYLNSLTLSSGTLSPVFEKTTSNYTATTGGTISSVTVTPVQNNPNSTIKVNGVTVASGTASASIPLVTGNTSISVVVTAQDGTTKKNYTIVVTRPSNNAYLSDLSLSDGTLSPAFAMTTSAYTASVANGVSAITVTPTLNNPHGSIKVNGNDVVSGAASPSIPLAVGDNTISTTVTAQDGTTHKTYTVTVTRAMSGLNSLYLPGGDASSQLTFSLNQKIEASNILSPNGDGINDIWVVKNIAFYPDNTVTVYDREGKIVFTRKGYTNDWAGTYRGSVLNEGTYYYSINLGDGTAKKGFITVVSH